MKIILVIYLLTALNSLTAATPGGLSNTELKSIKKQDVSGTNTQLVQNAVARNNIDDLVLSQKILRGNNSIFTHSINVKNIRNQQNTGTCWIYAGVNLMRAQYSDPGLKLSVAYLSFWDKMEKANLYLERAISMREREDTDREWSYILSHSLAEGGWWNYVVSLVNKYGVVPQSIMPDTYSSSNTNKAVIKLYTAFLRKCAFQIREKANEKQTEEELREFKIKCLKKLYCFLVINYGKPPETFKYRVNSGHNKTIVKEYSPLKFYKNVIKVDLNDYKCFYNNPTQPYYKHLSKKFAAGMSGAPDLSFVNLPIEQMKKITQKSIENKEAVWFSADVYKDQNHNLGIMEVGLYDYNTLFDMDFKMSKKERVLMGAGYPTHSMLIVGMDVIDNNSVAKWQVENSWGSELGNKGKWNMYDKWFNEHVYLIVANKKYVSPEILKIFETEKNILPPWAP